jgi:hypothetical protein
MVELRVVLGVASSSVMTPASLITCDGIHLIWYIVSSFPLRGSL